MQAFLIQRPLKNHLIMPSKGALTKTKSNFECIGGFVTEEEMYLVLIESFKMRIKVGIVNQEKIPEDVVDWFANKLGLTKERLRDKETVYWNAAFPGYKGRCMISMLPLQLIKCGFV